MLRFNVSKLVAVALLLVLWGCTKAGKFDERFMPNGEEPGAKLVFEEKWGNGKGELGKTDDIWSPSFEYYFVRGDEVFIADQANTEVKYYKGGKYVRSYDYSFIHSNLFGLVVIDDVMYWFADLDGAVGVSIKDGQVKYSRGFPFTTDQNRVFVYQFEKLIVVSENAINERGTIIRMCLAPGLLEVKCPNFVMPEKNFEWSLYQYLSLDQVAFFRALREAGAIKPRVIYTDHGMRKIQGAAFTNDKEQARYEMLGKYLISKDGVYYALDTEQAAQIWFKPWWNSNNPTNP